MEKITFDMVRLAADEDTIAIVKVLTDHPSLDDIIEALIAACTDWAKNTEAGRSAWIDSDANFNIGDLATLLEDEDRHSRFVAPLTGSIGWYLQKHGIMSITVDCHVDMTKESGLAVRHGADG